MRVPDLLKPNKRPFSFSVEITPPVRGTSIATIFDVIDSIRGFKPLWIDVTSHAADTEWVKTGSAGGYKKRTLRKSPGTIAICAAIEHKFGIPTVPHLLCHGFSREETEDALIDLHYLGVRNVLAIRGDGSPKPLGENQTANVYALDLVKQVSDMNQGSYQHQQAEPTNFTLGVACYPEKHFEAPNANFCMSQLLKKQQVGADYAVTQMFFDNQKFYQFEKAARAANVEIPIVPALKILTSKKQLVNLPKHFYIDLPPEFVDRVEAATTKEEVIEIGIDWTTKQCLDMLDNGFTHFHFYIMKLAMPLLQVLERLHKKANQRLKVV